MPARLESRHSGKHPRLLALLIDGGATKDLECCNELKKRYGMWNFVFSETE